MRVPSRICLITGLWAAGSSALAQVPNPGEQTTPPPPSKSAEADVAPVPQAAPGTHAAEALPDEPAIDDPMLAPVERPKNVVTSWKRALLLVRANSTTLKSSQARIAQASAQGRQAVAGALPTLNATGSVDRHLLLGKGVRFSTDGVTQNTEIPDPAAVWTGRLQFRQPVLNLGVWQDIGTSNLTTNAAELDAKDAERLALAELADAVVNVYTAERLAEISRIILKSSLSTLDLTERRARLGAATAVDVLRAKQEVLINRSQVVNSNESIVRSREALGLALGYAEPWGVPPDLRLDGLAQDARRVCKPVTDVLDRADVHAAQVRTDIAERNRSRSGYDYAPRLDLTSDLSYTTNPFTSNGKPVQWTVGALLTIPIYDGGATASRYDQQRAAFEIASQSLNDTKRRAALQAAQATRSVGVARANLAVSQNARDVSKEAERLARVSFLHGRGTSFDLVDAGQRYRQAEIDLVVKEFELARTELVAALALSNCDI